MTRFFATFPAGTYDIIARDLKRFKISELVMLEHDDSSLVFDTALTDERIIEVRYFTNAYRVLDRVSDLDPASLTGRFYQLTFLKNGRPETLSDGERESIERDIGSTFHLIKDAHKSRNNFVVIERENGARFLTLRLSRAKFKRDELEPGELRPELAHVLCVAARLSASHTVVDPFAGHGSIALEAVRGFGCRAVYASDVDLDPARRQHDRISWQAADARSLTFLDDDSVDRIVTDPPWGQYRDQEHAPGTGSLPTMADLYSRFAAEALRVLRPDGLLVALTGFAGAAAAFETAQAAIPASGADAARIALLEPLGCWNVLVSGRSASILKYRKLVRRVA
ncbi:MAG: hypothetical protein EA382_11975, partial [Spirochaetaceae bacterium]